MAEYIEREKLMEKFCWHCDATACGDDECFYKRTMYSIPAADVQPVKHGKNIATDYDEVDQFVCSECGIELQNWVRVEHDEDDGNETYHEYRFNFCPNCGADMRGADNG